MALSIVGYAAPVRGRKPKPVEQRRRDGNPGKRPLPEPVIVKGRVGLVKPELPEHASELWDEIVPALEGVGIVDAIDRAMLETLCHQYQRVCEARAVIAKEGLMARGFNGQPVEHPAVRTERAAATELLRYAEHYALTPIARTRLGLAELARRTQAEELYERIGRRPREITAA